MKRYRTMNVDFDSRSNALKLKIEEDWNPSVKALHEKNKKQVREGLQLEFGLSSWNQKEKNLVDIGSSFPSVIFFHNKFLKQARSAFVMGAYYPAFTGITTLTERILNHLIIQVREDFKHTDEYKKVYNKDSFTDWDQIIRILESWDVILSEAKPPLKKLQKLRHQYAAHFNPETDRRDREFALDSILAFQEFIKLQFGFFGDQPWFIPGCKGEFFIKREYETHPFVKRIYLPNCVRVGPKFRLETVEGGFQVFDEEYPDVEITDNEFLQQREEFKNAQN